MQNDTNNIGFGGEEFWKLYDKLCTEEGLKLLISGDESCLVSQLQSIAIAAHMTREIHSLSRPERGWKYHRAWLTLRNANIQRYDGEFGIYVRAGDVVVVEHGWDRDVIITHCPIETNRVSGYLLSGKWEPMIGLFLPLFDKKTINTAIELRLAENVKEARELAEKEAKDWHWY